MVRTLVEARDDIDLARDPARVVGRGAVQCSVEKLLVRRSEAADVDDDVKIARDGQIAQHGADLPCGIRGEAGQGEVDS